MKTAWQLKGSYIMACNCDYGCPCNFNARPTRGSCEGIVGILVDKGTYGAVRLDGSKLMLALKWPGAVHEGNGVGSVYLDEKDSPEQRDALYALLQAGVPAGFPLGLYLGTLSHVIGPRTVNVDFHLAGKDTTISVGEHARCRLQPIRNPVTKAEVAPKVVLPQGLMVKEADQFTTTEFWVDDGPELQYTHLGKAAQIGPIAWQGET
ncbi:MAG: DUF1326 domain-containing protein [Gemmatimonadota bacterium]